MANTIAGEILHLESKSPYSPPPKKGYVIYLEGNDEDQTRVAEEIKTLITRYIDHRLNAGWIDFFPINDVIVNMVFYTKTPFMAIPH